MAAAAAAAAAAQTINPTTTNPKPMRVCFSFAAYAKNLIDHLKTCNIPVVDGLSDLEFSSIESSFGFTFPPDLRSILREGLPIGAGFPNWRSSSHQQLQILINLPILGICKEVSRGNFWFESWGDRPSNADEAQSLAKRFLKKSPILVPIYRNCYIPSSPNLAGNPVFFVHGCDVKLWSFDVTGLFQKVEFWPASLKLSLMTNVPAWAATSARRIQFWSEMVEVSRGVTCGWWSNGELERCLEEVFWRLRDAGWEEEEVREMMMMDGGDDDDNKREMVVIRDKAGVVWHVRVMSLKLLRGGWSSEDVVYSLGHQDENGLIPKDESLYDFQYSNRYSKEME